MASDQKSRVTATDILLRQVESERIMQEAVLKMVAFAVEMFAVQCTLPITMLIEGIKHDRR